MLRIIALSIVLGATRSQTPMPIQENLVSEGAENGGSREKLVILNMTAEEREQIDATGSRQQTDAL